MPKQKKTSRPSANGKTEEQENILKNIEIRVNTLGQIERDFNIDDINAFLNKHVPDKKLEE